MKEKINYFFTACPPHFFIICACIFMQMLNWGEGYRFMFHLNLIMVLVSSLYLFDKKDILNSALFYLLSIPVIFLVIHLFSGAPFIYTGEIRAVILTTFLMLGIWMLAKKDLEYVTKKSFSAATWLLFLYVVSQAFSLWWLDKPYGTLKNPHYLAFNSTAALIVSLYFFFRVTFPWKLLFGSFVLLLGTFILISSSRPIWIGIIGSGLLMIFFIERRYRISVVLSMISTLLVLILTNVANFTDRFKSLLMNLDTEERVQIWQDVWRMQMDSSFKQWLVGHGINSFEDNFITYSAYHFQNIDFHSPHNHLLEMLYVSGTLGLALFLVLIFSVYRILLSGINNNPELKDIYLLLFCLLTTNLIAVSITVSFFTRYNLTMIGLVVGGLLIMRQIALRKSI